MPSNLVFSAHAEIQENVDSHAIVIAVGSASVVLLAIAATVGMVLNGADPHHSPSIEKEESGGFSLHQRDDLQAWEPCST